ncbi:MAG: hypothetical protein ACR2QF_03120 [Geminicoccaceae bacterium]
MTRRDEQMEAAAFLRECLVQIADAIGGDDVPDLGTIRARLATHDTQIAYQASQLDAMGAALQAQSDQMAAMKADYDAQLAAAAAQRERHRRRLRRIENFIWIRHRVILPPI